MPETAKQYWDRLIYESIMEERKRAAEEKRMKDKMKRYLPKRKNDEED